MTRKEEIEYIKWLPLEEKAKKSPKELSCIVSILILLPGIIAGICYWFVSDFIFSYDTITPFWGFVIFTGIGIALYCLVSSIYSSMWKEYNNEIKKANEGIKAMIDQGQGSPEQLDKMKMALIERQIGTDSLSQDYFDWHSKRVCWGCGKVHIKTPRPYTYYYEKTESWKDGAYRKTQTFRTSAVVFLCPECYERLSVARKIKSGNDEIIDMIKWGIILVLSIIFLIYMFNDGWGKDFFDSFVVPILSTILFFGIASSLGLIVIYPIAWLLSLPFTKKEGNNKTKWDFEEIPKIRRFRTTDQHKKD